MEFDDIFLYIGEFGTYQLVLFLTLGLLSFFPGWQNMGMAILGESRSLYIVAYYSNSTRQQKNVPTSNVHVHIRWVLSFVVEFTT